jgi:transcriptional antiterminator RfaH
MTDWHVALTIPQSDRFACENLRHRGYRVYRPIFPKVIRHFRNGPNRTRSVIRSMFPGYLFVADDRGQGWLRFGQCPGVRNADAMLKTSGPDGHYVIVPSAVIDVVRAKEQELCTVNLTLAETHGFSVGQQVKIAEGPFMGFLAKIEALDDSQRIVLLMWMLGRESRVSLPVEHLASAS